MDKAEFENRLKKAIEPLKKVASLAKNGKDEGGLEAAWPLFSELIRLTTGLVLPPDKEMAMDLIRMASPSVERLCEAMTKAAARFRAKEGGAKLAALWEKAREIMDKLAFDR